MSHAEYVVTAQRGGGQPSGRRFAHRLAEAFFRRWPLYVAPLALITLFGVSEARSAVPMYTAAGTLRVGSNSLLSSVTPSAANDGFYWETPAATTARQINEQLSTDVFLDEVATAAGLQRFIDAGVLPRDQLRAALSIGATGASLLKIAVAWDNPTTSLAIAQAIIDEYIAFVLDGQVLESSQAEAFWDDLEQTYQKQLDAAEDAFASFVQANPAPEDGDRPDDQVIQLTRLSDDVKAAQSQVTNAQNKQQEAALLTQQARNQVGESLQVVDSPRVPRNPESGARDQILTVAMYAVLGAIVTSAALLVATLLDRSVRSPDDITAATGLQVVATVPVIRRLRRPGADPALQPPTSAA